MPVFTNTAVVNSTDSAILCGITTDTATLTTPILPASAALTVTKEVSATEVCAGDVITYTLTVRNTSAAPKTFTLLDTINVSPGGTILPGDVLSTSPVASSITQVPTGLHVQWTNTTIPGKIPPATYYQQTYTITLATTCAMVGNLSDLAIILFEGADNIPSNTVTTLVKAVVDLSVEKTKVAPPDPVYVGDTIEYDIAVTNLGPCNATGVYVDDTLPVSSLIVPGQPLWVPQGGNTYRYTIGNLAAGATVHIPLFVVPTAPSVP